MSSGTFEVAPPQSSAEFRVPDPARSAVVDLKQQQVAELLKRENYDGLLLRQPSNFAWFTGGGICRQSAWSESATALLVTPDARVVIANNVDSAELFDKELSGLGFQLKERPWHERREVLLDDVCRGRKLLSDTGYGGTRDVSAELLALRATLAAFEADRMQQLARQVSHAVEATARTILIGQTEAEIAAQLSHRLLNHELTPVDLRVVADGRGRLYRHWGFSETPLRRWCTISAVATRWGLCCAAARTVCIGNPPDELALLFQQVAMLQATGAHFSLEGTPFVHVWDKVKRIYEKVGHADEWQLCDQAALIGYQPIETTLFPQSNLTLAVGHCLHWHPSIGPVQLGDTYLVSERGPELLTLPEQWPTLQISVRGHSMLVPDMLCREQA